MALIVQDAEALSQAVSIAPASSERILFALSESERAQFFPHFRNESLYSVPCVWEDPSTTNSRDWLQQLKQVRPTILVSCWVTPRLPAELLFTKALPLRYVCHAAGSVKSVVPREFISAGGLVTNWGNLVSAQVAEHALLLILACLKNLPRWYPAQNQKDHQWGNSAALKTRSLKGKKIGIHGFGNIARELIRLLQPFEVDCSVYSQNVPSHLILEKGATPSGSLKDLFLKNEIVVECEALTPQTRGVITEELLGLMRQDAIFVNIARGAIVDEKALAHFAAQGRIRVASDVFQTEPLPDNSALRNIKNLIVSPHIGGPTEECHSRCGEFALSNIDRYLKGHPLEGIVDLAIYDRST